MQKIEVARRQLGAALALFIENGDPVSVHTLACAGCEIAEHLTRKAGMEPFTTRLMKLFSDLDIVEIRTAQRQYCNAFKHATSRKGKERDDQSLLDGFTDEANDQALFVGWNDYNRATGTLPIEAQVLTVWYWSRYSNRVDPEPDLLRICEQVFPSLSGKSRAEQKRALREVIALYREDRELMSDPATERLPLILPALDDV